MKRSTNFKGLAVMALAGLFAFSCEKNNEDSLLADRDGMNIVETAQETDVLGSLVAALVQADAGLVTALSDETETYTVFAPTNDAFSALLAELDGYDSLDDFDTPEEKALLAKILTYHVVPGIAAVSSGLTNGQEVPTLQGESVTVGIRAEGEVNVISVKDKQPESAEAADILIADIAPNNGIVHVIDKVLLPQEVLDALSGGPMADPGTLVDLVVATEPLSILKDAVIKAGLAETLASDGPFTVFAPTNDAFVALLDILGDDYNGLDDFDTEAELMLLKDILLYHVIPNATVKAADLAEGEVGTAFTGNSIAVIASGDTFVVGDASGVNANITGTDIMASNGVAHTIDKVLLPQAALDFVASLSLRSIVEIAVATDDLSLLVGALQQADAGLVEVLSAPGTYTVFAPTNEAFVALLDALGDDYNSLADFDTPAEKELLVKVLTYHVVGDIAAKSTDLSDGQMISTLQGEAVTISIKNGTVHILDATGENATVAIPDVIANNGVVHVIDKVLLPQEVLDLLAPSTPNIVELAQSVPDLSLLVEALIQADAGLVEVLNGGTFTVFAPTNAAFADLLDALGDGYHSLADFDTAAEKELLAKVLTYHVVSGAAVASTDLTDHQELVTVQGESLFALTGHGVAIRDKSGVDANVVLADQLASNGIVHVIDKVLLPQEVLDALAPPSH